MWVFTWAKGRQECLALEQLYNSPSNRLEEVQHLIRQGDELQEATKTLQPTELWVTLEQTVNRLLGKGKNNSHGLMRATE